MPIASLTSNRCFSQCKKRLLEVREAIGTVLVNEDRKELIMDTHEWSILEDTAKILKKFEKMSKNIRTENDLTLNHVLPCLHIINRHLGPYSDVKVEN